MRFSTLVRTKFGTLQGGLSQSEHFWSDAKTRVRTFSPAVGTDLRAYIQGSYKLTFCTHPPSRPRARTRDAGASRREEKKKVDTCPKGTVPTNDRHFPRLRKRTEKLRRWSRVLQGVDFHCCAVRVVPTGESNESQGSLSVEIGRSRSRFPSSHPLPLERR